ncbi:helix-turn-helix transcriptional regulator [Jatrophihabitans sp. DSM 45814]
MTRRVTSDRFIGRDAEVATLRAVIGDAAAGQSRIVAIGGDAGIGKTRLIGEAVSIARASGLLVGIGGCLNLGSVSIPYAPVVEALRTIRSEVGVAEFDVRLTDAFRGVRALIGDGSDTNVPDAGTLFEHLLGFLASLSADRPVLLVFEDLHWSDSSTRDLVAFLARNLRDVPVVLLLTYRTDELHRRHPLRPLLSDLDRLPGTERLTLSGFSRGDVAQLIAEIDGPGLDADAVDELVNRSGGNPFYVEELTASGSVAGRLPDTLAEAILDRVGRLDPQTQQALRIAAVLGVDVDEDLVAVLAGVPAATITIALREAVTEQLLVIEGDRCRFRHALVAEALYDDLLPGERNRLHVAAADAFASAGRLDEHARWAMIAHHRHSASQIPQAYSASVRAGLEAEKVHAPASAAEQYERALGLYDQVPDAIEISGLSHLELLQRAGNTMYWTANLPRALALFKQALSELGADALPEDRALIFERIGRIAWTDRDGERSKAAYEQAVALLADRPSSREKAFVYSALGQSLMLDDRTADAERFLRVALEAAEAAGARDVTTHALCSLGAVLVESGLPDEGIDTGRRALEMLLEDEQMVGEAGRAYNNLVHSLVFAGRYEEAIREGRAGIEYAIASGITRHLGEAVAGNTILALTLSGRWDEAAAVRLDHRIPTGSNSYKALRCLPLLFGTGQIDLVREIIDLAIEATTEAADVQHTANSQLYAAELAALDGKFDAARAHAATGLARCADSDGVYYLARGLAVALQVEADRVAQTRGTASDSEVATARQIADELAVLAAKFAERPEALALPECRGWIKVAAAEYDRVWARDNADQWRNVAETWDEVGVPHYAALARYRQADTILRDKGDRTMAADAVRSAATTADRLGAVPLRDALAQLAKRARLDIVPGQLSAPERPDVSITQRELDVLRLLAIGRTNREIGRELFISEKTASVHVTNLLRKLDVGNRVEAGVAARHAGLV